MHENPSDGLYRHHNQQQDGLDKFNSSVEALCRLVNETAVWDALQSSIPQVLYAEV